MASRKPRYKHVRRAVQSELHRIRFYGLLGSTVRFYCCERPGGLDTAGQQYASSAHTLLGPGLKGEPEARTRYTVRTKPVGMSLIGKARSYHSFMYMYTENTILLTLLSSLQGEPSHKYSLHRRLVHSPSCART